MVDGLHGAIYTLINLEVIQMPKFIGNNAPAQATRIEDNAQTPVGYVRLSYSQMRLLPGIEIAYSLDTSDRGSKGSYAKRWYRWFALARAIEVCPQSTRLMRERAAEVLARSAA